MRAVARVVVGVTGGIAAYKACELVRQLVRAGHEVVPLLTPAAERFVTEETFAALARRSPDWSAYPHLERADLFVVAPCSANTLAKLAHGLADNLLTESALAHEGPLLLAPAMNPRMWAHPATQANAETLRGRDAEQGVGRMVEPEEIFARLDALLSPSNTVLLGRRVLVTAGGTREPLDAVRFVGNRSSGRMGAALAAEARRRGADVTLLAANLAVPPPAGVELVETPTAADVERETLARADADLVLMAAAVADYRPAEARDDKRRKEDASWHVELEPTTDVLRAVTANAANGRVVVGFAAETGADGVARAREKLLSKHLDLIVLNDVSRRDVGFDAPNNEVVLVTPDAERTIAKAPKARVAAVVLDEAERLLEAKRG